MHPSNDYFFQGIIYSKTAADNYKDFGGDLMKDQIPWIPVKRLGTPEEVSAAVCFLLSPASAFTTGVSIRVDGAKSLYSSSLHYDNIPGIVCIICQAKSRKNVVILFFLIRA